MDIKHIAVIVAVAGLTVLLARRGKLLGVPFLLALAVSLAWTTYYRYEYVGTNVLLFNRINVYPLSLWTAGLTLLYFGYTRFRGRYRLIAATAAYFVLLAGLEVIGYYLLGIRLDSNFTSLLNLGVIHAPPAMKIFYVVAGPLYLLLLRFIEMNRYELLRKK